MNAFFTKLLLGRPEENISLKHTALENQKLNLKKVWNNEKHNDFGVEKLFRLFLITIQFIFPGIYIRDKYGRKGLTYKNLAIDFYVLTKTTIALMFLVFGLYSNGLVLFFAFYFLAETLLYIFTLIFVADLFAKARSYKRTILLLLFNYIEIVFDFAILYAGFNLLNCKAKSTIDFIYFSFITSATVGYGDIYPMTNFGKILVSFQTIVFLVFIVLFFNFFSSKIESKDYFNEG